MAIYPTWVNGGEQALVPVTDRGLAYGDGLFETIRVVSGKLSLLDMHLDRLQSGASQLGIAVDIKSVKKELVEYLSCLNQREGIVKLILTRGSGGRGYSPDGCLSPVRILSFYDLPAYPNNPSRHGIRLYSCKTRVGRSALAGLKHLNRLENVLARAEWGVDSGCPDGSDGFSEGLLLDFDGRLIEGTMTNLFLVKDGILKTPSLNYSGVKGVARGYILRQSRSWGVNGEECDLTLSDLTTADEVFVCNSVNGVWPVLSYENLSWKVGSVTVNVRDRFLEELNA